MKNLLFKTLICSLICFSQLVTAQDTPEEQPQDNAAELAKKAQNPIANMISVPLQNNTNFGIGEYERSQNVLNIQPVIPASLGKWNLINRFIAPITWQPDVLQADGTTVGLGDIVYQGFFTPAKSSGSVTWGVGPVLIFPTATDIRLGSEKWSAGPAGIVVAFVNKWVLGGVIYNAWSYAGNNDRADVNSGVFQYFVNYNLPKAWYLTSAPILSVNWKARKDDQWIIPFGAGAGKIFGIGKQKFNGQVGAYYNAVKPATMDGPDWSLRFQLVFLFPK
ncbi:MAG: hypothetical protein WBN19_06835 [Lutimonas sp.]